ncbi:MAG TPA: ABC transporter substrate-binding protein [Thermoleophilaceae bacterium]|nr:ABC transporter substrate-binding protein [Thermoleophilaceae bacterium]
MSKLLKTMLVLAVVLAATLGIVACGDDDDDGGGGGTGKTGGTIKITHSSFPDFLDPGLSYTVDGWEALSTAYPGLVTFPHDQTGTASAEIVPALAEDLPEISNGGKTYTFKLRDGLQFSDGSDLKASDFKASIERILEMDSQGAGLGFTSIVGGEEYLTTKEGGVDGIKVDDATGKIEITLEEPRGPFLYELAIPFAGVVPADTPAKNQTQSPPPGAGAYTFVDSNPPRSYSLVKNENFSPSLEGTAVDAGNVDRIDVVVTSENNAVTQVAQGKLDFMVDNPPPDRIGEVAAKYPERYHQFVTNSTFYFFLNSSVPPFDNLKARQAANHAIDPDALNRVQGGVLSPAWTTLPPGVPGYQEDHEDMYPYDLEKAKQLVEESGTKGMDVTVYANPENPTKQTMEYWTEVLNDIGYNAEIRIVPAETYFTTIGDRSLEPQTGWANWYQDYPHPADFIDILLNPDNVVATGNNNYSYTEDPKLADMINAANREPELTPEVQEQWGEIDKYIQEQAYWGIYGNRKQSTFFSERMDFENCKGEHSVYTHDWHQFCLK